MHGLAERGREKNRLLDTRQPVLTCVQCSLKDLFIARSASAPAPSGRVEDKPGEANLAALSDKAKLRQVCSLVPSRKVPVTTVSRKKLDRLSAARFRSAFNSEGSIDCLSSSRSFLVKASKASQTSSVDGERTVKARKARCPTVEVPRCTPLVS